MIHLLPLLTILISNLTLWNTLEFLLFVLCLLAISYYGYAMLAAIDFLSSSPPVDANFKPPISILKPICGYDNSTYSNLASFCQQNYESYQIIFGVQDAYNPSLKIVHDIMQDFPTIDIQVVTSDYPLGSNRKVSNLASAMEKAKYDILLLADSDVRVESNYLQEIIQPLKNPRVGVVTCIYRSCTKGWLTHFEALSTSTDFHPGVLVSRKLEGIKFAMGQTILIRKSTLNDIGGFATIADYLADDFQLGYLSAQAGYEVILSHYIVNHVIMHSTIMDALHRQSRWMMGIRVSRPWGYVGLIITFGTVTSLLFLLLTGGSLLGWVVLGATWSSRLLMAWLVGIKILGDPVARQWFWLVPLRDIVSFGLWGYGFFSNRIEWSGQHFKLTLQGKLVEDNSDGWDFISLQVPKLYRSMSSLKQFAKKANYPK